MLKQGDRGQRIGFSTYAALQRLIETSRPDAQAGPGRLPADDADAVGPAE